MMVDCSLDDCQGSYRQAGVWPAAVPLLLSSPHSGRRFSDQFDAFALMAKSELVALDDGPVDQILSFAGAIGASLISANYSRAVVDLNRAPDECLPFLLEEPGSRCCKVTARSRAGLGVVPTRLGLKPIYDRPLPKDELAWRIDELHASYHHKIAETHRELLAKFAVALLLDIHTMPDAVSRAFGREIDIALGNCHHRSCPKAWTAIAADQLRRQGLRVAVNAPYAGGYVTSHHGRPGQGLPALQIEIRRSLLFDENYQQRSTAARIISVLEDFCGWAATSILDFRPKAGVDAA